MTKPKRQRDPLVELAQIQFMVVAGSMARQAEVEVLQDSGIRLIESRIIYMVGSVDACPFKVLTIFGDFDKGHASRTVTALVAKGLMTSEADSRNKRATLLRLTPAGKRLYREIIADAVRRNERWLGVLPADERNGFTRALAALYRAAASFGPDEFRKQCTIAPERRPGKVRSPRK
jgi:DNA-binding MarR family transcriptional regulator